MASKYSPINDDDEDRQSLEVSPPAQNDFDDPLLDCSGYTTLPSFNMDTKGDEKLLNDPPSYSPRHQNFQPSQGHPPSNGSSYQPGSYVAPPGQYMPPYGFQATNNTTTVIVQQPSQPQFIVPRNWTSHICDCGHKWSICCCGLFCSCCLESQVAQDMGESCLLPCCVPGWLITLRTKMRVQENITGSVLDDCCHVCCCGPCTLCQLAYEIDVVQTRQMARSTHMRPV